MLSVIISLLHIAIFFVGCWLAVEFWLSMPAKYRDNNSGISADLDMPRPPRYLGRK